MGLGQNSVSRVCVSVQFAPPPSSKMRSRLAGDDRSLRQIHVRVSRMFDWKLFTKFRIRGKRREHASRRRKLFPLLSIYNNIRKRFIIQVKNRVENRAEFKVKGILTRKWRQGKEILLVGVIKLSKRKKGRREKVSRASLWVQSRATIIHFLYLLHLSVSQVSQLWLLINHEISIYNLW